MIEKEYVHVCAPACTPCKYAHAAKCDLTEKEIKLTHKLFLSQDCEIEFGVPEE